MNLIGGGEFYYVSTRTHYLIDVSVPPYQGGKAYQEG